MIQKFTKRDNIFCFSGVWSGTTALLAIFYAITLKGNIMSSKKISKICKLLPMLFMAGALCTPMMSHATVCPAAGSASDCNVLFTIGSGNAITTTFPDPTPYDGIEDMLVGVSNFSGGSIASLTLSGNSIFGFDGDGISNYTFLPSGPTGYEGPNTSFNVVDYDNGTVFFSGGLADGASAYFSLEYPASAFAQGGGGTVGVSPVPEPETYAMLLAGLGLIGFAARRRSKGIQSSSPNARHGIFSRMATVALTMCLGLAAGAVNASALPTFTLTGSTWDATFGNTYSGSFSDVYNFTSPGGGTSGGTNAVSGYLTGFNTIFSNFSLTDTTTSTTLASGSTGWVYSSFSFLLPNTTDSYALNVSGSAAPGYSGGSYSGNMSITAVPESKTYAMVLLGLCLIGFSARRKHNV